MGFNAVKAFERSAAAADGADDRKPILVVLTGSGHVAYGLGIERQVAQWFDGEVASLIPVSVQDEDGELVDRVQGSYADFVWGLPRQEAPLYPSLGISSRKGDDGRRTIIHLAEESTAQRAGLAVGDFLLAVDGVDLVAKGVFSRLMAEKRWGDAVSVTVERAGETLEIEVLMRRQPEGRG